MRKPGFASASARTPAGNSAFQSFLTDEQRAILDEALALKHKQEGAQPDPPERAQTYWVGSRACRRGSVPRPLVQSRARPARPPWIRLTSYIMIMHVGNA